MGKIYVVFVGSEPGIYDTWAETSLQVTGYKGCVHQSFKNREEVEKAFRKYAKKQCPAKSFTSPRNDSHCSASSSRTSTHSGSTGTNMSNTKKKVKLTDVVLKLSNENQTHAVKMAEILEEIKEQIECLQLSGDGELWLLGIGSVI